MKEGSNVVCVDTLGTILDERIIYKVARVSLDGKHIMVYGYTKLYKINRFKTIEQYRKDKLLSALYDLKRNGVFGIQKRTL